MKPPNITVELSEEEEEPDSFVTDQESDQEQSN
jgi:hypothetical protein